MADRCFATTRPACVIPFSALCQTIMKVDIHSFNDDNVGYTEEVLYIDIDSNNVPGLQSSEGGFINTSEVVTHAVSMYFSVFYSPLMTLSQQK